MIEIKRKYTRMYEINLIPLINVIFVLLIFFMIAGKIVKPDMLQVNLPVSKLSEASINPDNNIMVYIDKEGNIAVNKDFVARQDLRIILETLLLEKKNAQINIKADAQLSASKLIELIDNIEKSGGQHVSVFTEFSS